MAAAADAPGYGIGAPLPRKEDARLLTGQGRFSDDLVPDGVVHAVFVRSPHAHARIRAISPGGAATSADVIAILTGEDVAADQLAPIPHGADWTGAPDVTLRLAEGFEPFRTDHHILPRETVRFAGEAVAVVLAESWQAAVDAAEAVEVDYQPLPAVASALNAVVPGGAMVWPDCAGNVALDCEVGDRLATERAFAAAKHVVSLSTWVQRVSGTPMEPRSIIAEYDADSDRVVLHAGSGRGIDRVRRQLAEVLRIGDDRVRVVCGDMGGNFGTRNAFPVEAGVVAWAARRLRRPVKWTGGRHECLLAEYQGRVLAVEAELALDEAGTFLAMRGSNVSNVGAYTTYFAPLRKGLGIMHGVYRMPSLHFRGRAVLTNTVPTTVYRSTGRPEAIYVIERLIDMAAAAHGFDRIELRRRNLIPADDASFTNAVGVTYDNGAYERCMNRALSLADWQTFGERRAASEARGMKRGIGLANYIEGAGGTPRERAEITVRADGGAEIVLGTMNSGQGHETSFSQLVTEWLGIPFDQVTFVGHDTDRVVAGGGSHSGRSMRLGSLAVREAVDDVIRAGKLVAGRILQADVDAVEFIGGVFGVRGGGSVTLGEAAAAARSAATGPGISENGLVGIGDITVRDGAFPYGAHVCEVEVDPQTGAVAVAAWTGVDDVGVAVNPLILHGQMHGAVAQGAGQALLETIHFDRETAQPLAVSFLDYAIPRIDMLPQVKSELMEVPAASHRFGIRPGGEGGTTPALGAVVNAVVDALSEFGVTHIEMPLTAERVWSAIQSAQLGQASVAHLTFGTRLRQGS